MLAPSTASTSTPVISKFEHTTHVIASVPSTTSAFVSSNSKVDHKTHASVPSTTSNVENITKVEHKPYTSSAITPLSSNMITPSTTSTSVSTSSTIESKPLSTTMPQETSLPSTIDETTIEFIKTFAGQWYLTAETMELANSPRPCRTITIFENENKLFFKTATNEGNQTFLVIDTLITEYNNISKTFFMSGLKYMYNIFHMNNINYLYINDSKYEYLYCNDYNCNSSYQMTPALQAIITENKYNIIITDMSCYTD